MSGVKTVGLIQVKTLKEKMARQIHFVPFEGLDRGSEHRTLGRNLLAGNCTVHGFAYAGVMDRGPQEMKLWLVEGPEPGRLRWFIAPQEKDSEGRVISLAEKYADLPQLFID